MVRARRCRPRRRTSRSTCRSTRSDATSSTRTARSPPATIRTSGPTRAARVTAGLGLDRRGDHAGQPTRAQPARRQRQHGLGSRGRPSFGGRLGRCPRARPDDHGAVVRPPHQRARRLAHLQPVPGRGRLRDLRSGRWPGSTRSSAASFERVQTTDVDQVTGIPPNRKYYHAVDLQAKLRARVLDRPLYLFYLGSFGSANPQPRPSCRKRRRHVHLRPVPRVRPLLRAHANSFLLAGYLGLENARAAASRRSTRRAGCPATSTPGASASGSTGRSPATPGLYVRHRWMALRGPKLRHRHLLGPRVDARAQDIHLTRQRNEATPTFVPAPSRPDGAPGPLVRRRALPSSTEGPGIRFNGLGRSLIQQSGLGGDLLDTDTTSVREPHRRGVPARPRRQRPAQRRDRGAGRHPAAQRVRRVLRRRA